MSWIAAPVGEVTTPMCLGSEGSGFLLFEQSFGQQFPLELLEGLLEGAEPRRFDVFNDNLEVAAVLVKSDLAADPDLISLFRWYADALVHAPEHGASHLAFPVFQGKIPVAGRGARKSGEFTFHPHLHKARFQKMSGLVVELADAECPGAGVLKMRRRRS